MRRNGPPEWEATRNAFEQALPADHLKFFRELELSVTLGDYFFVHAGVRPGVSLDAQVENDLLWARTEFLGEKKPFEKIIVHGHTVADRVFLSPSRIGVDTGAYKSGRLSAIRLERGQRSVITAGD
jgi:serine/threonine protein phosphatase 1